LRRQIQTQGQAYVRAHYSQSQSEQDWVRQIRQVLKQRHLAPIHPPGRADEAKRLPALALAAETPRYSLRLLRRIRRIGLRPSLVGAYRYADSLRQLRRFSRQLSAPQGTE